MIKKKQAVVLSCLVLLVLGSMSFLHVAYAPTDYHMWYAPYTTGYFNYNTTTGIQNVTSYSPTLTDIYGLGFKFKVGIGISVYTYGIWGSDLAVNFKTSVYVESSAPAPWNPTIYAYKVTLCIDKDNGSSDNDISGVVFDEELNDPEYYYGNNLTKPNQVPTTYMEALGNFYANVATAVGIVDPTGFSGIAALLLQTGSAQELSGCDHLAMQYYTTHGESDWYGPQGWATDSQVFRQCCTDTLNWKDKYAIEPSVYNGIQIRAVVELSNGARSLFGVDYVITDPISLEIFNRNYNPFGGCPYVYTWNGIEYAKDNNILPASETGNGSDTKDYYLLQQPLVPVLSTRQASLYSLQIREFENEIDYIDQVKLTAIDHTEGTNVAVTPEGQIITYADPAAPTSCIDNSGADRLSEIATMNGNVTDPSTYFQGNKDDWLLLDFGKVTGPTANLILRDDVLCPKDTCINVQVQNANGVWQTVEALLHPRAFWSIEAVNMTAYLPKTGDLQIRLLWTAFHRLDYVGLDTSSPAQTTISSAPPVLAIHWTMGCVTAKLLYDDENCVKLVSGQQITLAFTLPNKAQGTTRDFILYVDGYYYTITP